MLKKWTYLPLNQIFDKFLTLVFKGPNFDIKVKNFWQKMKFIYSKPKM